MSANYPLKLNAHKLIIQRDTAFWRKRENWLHKNVR